MGLGWIVSFLPIDKKFREGLAALAGQPRRLSPQELWLHLADSRFLAVGPLGMTKIEILFIGNNNLKEQLLQQRASVAVWFFFWGQDYGGGYPVAGLQVEEADALGVAAGFADGFRIHADDFAVVADDHDLGIFVDQGDGDDFADALGRFHVDDAFAGAVGEAVFVGGGAFAVAVFGDGED